MSHVCIAMNKIFTVGLVFFGVVNSLWAQASDAPVSGIKASYFEGIWDCEVQGKDVGFTWEAKILMDGQWISGRTLVNGAHLSSDFWKVDLQGLPSKRRVFVSDGSYVELDRIGRKNNSLRLRGKVHDNKTSTQIREFIKRVSDEEFTASWEKKQGKRWVSQSQEKCRKREKK